MTSDLKITNPEEFRQDAFDLVKWGMAYNRLKTRHVACSRGMARGKIDVDQKQVSFEPPESGLSIYEYAPVAEELLFRQQRTAGETALLEVTREWMLHAGWSPGQKFTFDPSFIPTSPAFQKVIQWVDSVVLPELPDSTNISSYTLKVFRHFLAAVHALSYGFQSFSRLSREDAPSRVSAAAIIYPEAKMLEVLTLATGLESSVVRAVTADLTSNPASATLIHVYPLIKTKDGHIILSAAVFASTNLQRIAAGAITRMGPAGTRSYSAVQEAIEVERTAEITSSLERQGYHVLPGEKVVGKTPDFLVWDDQAREILVMDYKNFLPVIDSRSYLDRKSSIQKGIRQVREYVDRLRAAPAELSTVLGWDCSAHSIRGVLLTRFPMSIPHVHDPEVIVTDWNRLTKELVAGVTVQDLYASLPRPILIESSTDEIKVDDWIYNLVGLA